MQEPTAGPSTPRPPYMVPAESPYHESSQFRHWRYSRQQLRQLRHELNQKSVEVVAKNTQAEKEAQISLGHEFTDPPPQQAYLTVEDELLLLKFYCSSISRICRTGLGLPEVVESTAISYLKRFYLKNSVMEWHPKNIMPTCLFLAAKTTNFPIPIDTFVNQIAKLTPSDVLDTEFLVAQSLSFEFWARGAEKAVRGWGLELQEQDNAPVDEITKSIPTALETLHRSRLTDVEFLYTPSQIGLTCFFMSNPKLVNSFLDWRYSTIPPEHLARLSVSSSEEGGGGGGGGNDGKEVLPYGMERGRLVEILEEIRVMIESVGDGSVDMKAVKGVDKRLKGCLNPEKIPGTALYIKRKTEQEAQQSQARALKSLKAQKEMSDSSLVFGSVLPSSTTSAQAHGDEVNMNGMGIKDEGMGMIFGGKGLLDVGKGLDSAE